MKPITLLKKRPLIYCIQNTANGKVYVGKTRCIWKRCHQYLSDVRTGNKSQRINDHLYNSFIKYGIETFMMFPLEFVEDEKLLAERELWWMNFLNSLTRSIGYNIRYDSSSGMHVHQETREKISARLKEEWARGDRSSHSDKLKKSWEKRDKTQQSRLMCSILTKYVYVITDQNGSTTSVDYAQLRELGLQNVIAKFHKKKSSKESFKGVMIERKGIDESQT